MIDIPAFCLVLLMGASGSGKSTFAARHFSPTQVLSSDTLRAMVADDATDQSATSDAFEVLHELVARRLRRMRLTVVDATNVHEHARAPLLELARHHHAEVVIIALDVEPALCVARNRARLERTVPEHVVAAHHAALQHSLATLRAANHPRLVVLRGVDAIDAARLERVPLATDLRARRGPFDIVGDVHGCLGELVELLERLGYAPALDDTGGEPRWRARAPAGRTLVFVGDLVDRGPDSAGTLRLAMDLVEAGVALCVPGNHDAKLARALAGGQIKLLHGLDETLRQVRAQGEAFVARALAFLEGLAPHVVLDAGRLVVAHGGLEAHLHGRVSKRARSFALYGKTTGEKDAWGLPVRLDWAADYRGRALVVYGHTPVAQARWVNGTLDVDTGCVFGGRLTALRYPERELVSVGSRALYCVPGRPFLALPVREGAGEPEAALATALATLESTREVATRLGGTVRLPPGGIGAAVALLEGAGLDLRWWLGAPASLAPSVGPLAEVLGEEASSEAVAWRQPAGERAWAVVLREDVVAMTRFGLPAPGSGTVVGASGRVVAQAEALLASLRARLEAAGVFEALASDWVCVDGFASAQGFVGRWLLASASGVHVDCDASWHARMTGEAAPRLVAAGSGEDLAPGLVFSPAQIASREGVAGLLPLGLFASEAAPRALRLARSRAVRELALCVEGLERFVSGAPLAEVLMCVIARLAIGAGDGAP